MTTPTRLSCQRVTIHDSKSYNKAKIKSFQQPRHHPGQGSSRRKYSRRRPRPQQTVSPCFQISKPASVSFVFLCLFSVGYARLYNRCPEILKESDFESDGVLTSSEYANAIGELSHGYFDSDFSKLPLNLQETFLSLSQYPCNSASIACIKTDSSPEYVEKNICNDIELAVDFALTQQLLLQMKPAGIHESTPSVRWSNEKSPYPSPSMMTIPQPSPIEDLHLLKYPAPNLELRQNERNLQTQQQCDIAMSVGDQNRDDLLDEAQYVRFLNHLSRQQFGNIEFDELPQYFQNSFVKFANGGSSIDVTGSKPGSAPSPEQEEFLKEFCDETIAFLNDPPPPTEPTPTAPFAAPVAPVGAPGEINCDGTIERSRCNTALSIADLTRDDLLDEEEFVRFVNRLNINAFTGLTFNNLEENIQAVFYKFANSDGLIEVNGSKPGQSATPAQDTFLNQLCCEADLAADNPGAPSAPFVSPVSPPTLNPPLDCTGTIERRQCNTALAIADLSRDHLIDENEYLRFLNRLSNNEYKNVDFNDLPGNLIDNYDKFATTGGEIDITGSKPGQTPTPAQDEFITALCCETDLAVQNPGQPTTSQPGVPSGTPPTGTLPPTFLPTFCRTAMASSDLNRDNFLKEDEYVRFLNRLTQNEFQGLEFGQLEARLQENFVTLAESNGEINIFGSKPGQRPDDEELEHLETVCVSTAIALTPEQPSTPTLPTTQAPIEPQPSLPPTFQDTVCRTAIASSDFNRDDFLNEEEYVRMLNRLTSNQFESMEFEDLETSLSGLYAKLKGDSQEIPIFGAKPGQNGSEEEEAFILEICFEVALVLDTLLVESPAPTKSPSNPSLPTAPPTTAPTGLEKPTFPPGQSEVYNSFIIFNPFGLQAEDLDLGPNRDGLDAAYGEFAKWAVQNITEQWEQREARSSLRKRRLAGISYLADSSEIYQLQDSDCPESLAITETCQTAFANFRVMIESENPQEISEFYTTKTQEFIANGKLQEELERVDPLNALIIVNASLPVRYTFPPTPAPFGSETDAPTPSAPSTPPNSKKKKKSAVWLILLGIIGGFAALVLIGYLSSRFGGKKQGGNNEEDDRDSDDDEKDEDPKYHDPIIEKEADVKKPQLRLGDGKNVFGFAKRKKVDNEDKDDDNTFGSNIQQTLSSFGKDADSTDYAFDEPSEIAGKAEAYETGSVEADEKNSYGEPESLRGGWGGSNSFFGSESLGWGAGNPSGSTGDTFFANSTSGDEANTGTSRSGSEDSEYSSSDDGTYESEEGEEGDDQEDDDGDDEDWEEDSYSRSSAEEDDRNSAYSGSTRTGSEASERRRKSEDVNAMRESDNSDSAGDSASEDEEGSYSSGSMGSASGTTTVTTNTEDGKKRAEFHAQVDALVRLVLPDEVDKVDAMMEQFRGREAELISTLQTMQERSATQRARAAIHKSKARPQRADGQFRADAAYALPVQGENGGAAGTAAIAAASLPIPAAGMFDEGERGYEGDTQDDFGGQDSFNDEEVGEGEGSRSDYGGEEGSEGSRSYYSGDSRESRSYYSGQEGTEDSRSYYSGEDGSERSRSQFGEESRGSQSRGSQSQSNGSYYNRDEGTQGSRSQGSRSDYGGEEGSRSYDSEEEGSRESESYYSNEEGSQGSRSQFSDEESRSQYSGEEGSHTHGGEDSFTQFGSLGSWA